MPTLKLLFLGQAQILRDDEPVSLSGKAVALLAYLAVTGASQMRDHLADLFWPDSLPAASRKNMRNTLWSIRKALGDDVLAQPDADRVALSDSVWVDVRAFESAVQPKSAATKLQAAIDLFRAPLLDGLVLVDAPDFEIWLVAERERLGQHYLRALEAWVAAHRAEANWRDVIAVAQRALAYDVLQEPMYRTLMEAHARLGERAEALRQYDRLRASLTNELGVAPLPETDALRDAILSGDLPLRPAPARQPALEMRRSAIPFVGRQSERAVLDQELELATGGHARVVLLTGELGIGKSRLWQEWSAAQPSCPQVLQTRCLDTTQALPFAPLVSLFDRQACFESIFKPPSPIPPIWLEELAHLLPAIRQYWPRLPVSAALPPEEERRRLFEAFTQVLRALEDRPLILFVDDLHWADRATLDWLVYFIDRMRDEPLLLVCAYRPSDAPAQLANVAAGWGRQGVARQVPLPRLTLEESTELVRALSADLSLVEQLQAKSAGNPYFLIELSRALPKDTPPELAKLVLARLAGLPAATRQVLQAAAVLEPDFDFATLRRTSGRGEEETLDALDVLLDAAVLAERGERYEFVHPLVAMVVRGDLNIARRSFLNRRAAEALEATHADVALIAGRLAKHYAQAGRLARAAEYAELAAGRALQLTAHAEAATWYRQAFAWEPTPNRQLGLARALYLQGDLENARTTLSQARDGFEKMGDRPGEARACLAVAESYLPSGQGEQVVNWASQVLRCFDSPFDPALLAQAYYLLGAGGLQAGRPLAEVEAHLRQSVDLATENDLPEIAARSQFESGNLLAQRGDLPKAVDAFGKAIALSDAAGAHFLQVLGHNNLAYHAHLMGDLATAREHAKAGLTLAESFSLFVPRQYLYSTHGEIALAEGELDEAEGWFARALVEAEKYNNQTQAVNIRANQALVARARGDLDGALVLLQTAALEVKSPHLQTQIDLWLVELRLQRKERAAAEELLTQVEARLIKSGRKGLQTWARQLRMKLKQ